MRYFAIRHIIGLLFLLFTGTEGIANNTEINLNDICSQLLPRNTLPLNWINNNASDLTNLIDLEDDQSLVPRDGSLHPGNSTICISLLTLSGFHFTLYRPLFNELDLPPPGRNYWSGK